VDAYIVAAKRTALGRAHPDKGLFREVRADELLARLLRHFASEIIDPRWIDDVYIGCVGQHGEQGKNIARLSCLLAGYPEQVPGVTINRLCASSLQAFNFAAQSVACGQAGAILAGGVEHMHHIPMTAALDYHAGLLARYPFPFNQMGLTAEKLAVDLAIARSAQDEFSLRSHVRAVAAIQSGHFAREIVGEQPDQVPRANASMQALAALKPVFKENGTVTAGNSSALSDGASLTLLCNARSATELGLPTRARVLGFSVVGLDPCSMGLGPVPAIRKLLQEQGLRMADIDLFELNEAFAVQAIACVRELDLPMDKVNVAGGAIALGHPLGCTGTRLIATLLNNLQARDGELGIAAMCVGHGQGIATLLRREQ